MTDRTLTSLAAVIACALLVSAGCKRGDRADRNGGERLMTKEGGPLPTGPVVKEVEPPIVVMAQRGKTEEVRRLVQDEGVPVDTRGSLRMTPLIMAARMGHEDTVRVLLEHGADPNLVDSRGWTAQQWAQDGGYQQIAAMLEHLDDEAPSGPAKPVPSPQPEPPPSPEAPAQP